MPTSLIDLLRGYHLPASLQYWVVTQVRREAERLDQRAVVDMASAALPAVEHANELRRRLTISRKRRPGEARALSRRIADLVVGAWGMLDGLARQEVARSADARALLIAAFPSGLAGHVRASYVDQAAANAALLDLLRAPEHAAVVRWLHLDETADQLATLAPAFVEAMFPAPAVRGVDVAEADRLGENAVMRLVCGIIVAYDEADPARRALRDKLLRPLIRANDVLREQYEEQARGRDARPDEATGDGGAPPEGGSADTSPPPVVTTSRPDASVDPTAVDAGRSGASDPSPVSPPWCSTGGSGGSVGSVGGAGRSV